MPNLFFLLSFVFCSVAAPSIAENTPRVFELAGEKSVVGTWIAVEQQGGTAAILVSGETSIRSYGDTLSRASIASTLQITCSEGEVSVAVLLPNAAELAASKEPNWTGLFALFVDDERLSIVQQEVTYEDVKDSFVVVPLLRANEPNELLNKISVATSVTLSATNSSLFKVTGNFALSENGEAFRILERNCNWLLTP